MQGATSAVQKAENSRIWGHIPITTAATSQTSASALLKYPVSSVSGKHDWSCLFLEYQTK